VDSKLTFDDMEYFGLPAEKRQTLEKIFASAEDIDLLVSTKNKLFCWPMKKIIILSRLVDSWNRPHWEVCLDQR
jgi:hypothetical protein